MPQFHAPERILQPAQSDAARIEQIQRAMRLVEQRYRECQRAHTTYEAARVRLREVIREVEGHD